MLNLTQKRNIWDNALFFFVFWHPNYTHILPRGLLPHGHARNTSPGRRPGGILTIIPNAFNNIQTMDIMKAVAPLVTGSNLQ